MQLVVNRKFVMQSNPHIVIVEDHQDTREEIGECLSSEGFNVSLAASGEEMRQLISRESANLFLLDLNMPGEDGLSLARDIRRESEVGIIMVSGKTAEIDRVVGLEVGADDYITKPFSHRELLARVRNVLRRTSDYSYPCQSHDESSNGQFEFDGWRLDTSAYKLYDIGGKSTPLTTAEFRLLKSFVERPNQVLSRDYLLDSVHGQSWAGYDRSVDGLVSRLRRILSTSGAKGGYIVTVRNAGYLFSATVEKAHHA